MFHVDILVRNRALSQSLSSSLVLLVLMAFTIFFSCKIERNNNKLSMHVDEFIGLVFIRFANSCIGGVWVKTREERERKKIRSVTTH